YVPVSHTSSALQTRHPHQPRSEDCLGCCLLLSAGIAVAGLAHLKVSTALGAGRIQFSSHGRHLCCWPTYESHPSDVDAFRNHARSAAADVCVDVSGYAEAVSRCRSVDCACSLAGCLVQ